MVEQILNRISGSLAQVGKETGQFRKAADVQGRSMFGFIKDVSKMFTSQNKTQASINNSLDGIESSTQQTSAKVDQSNDLIRESISIQTNMLSELKNLSKGISSLLGGDGSEGSLIGTVTKAALAAAGGFGLGAATMSTAGQDMISNLTGINLGGGDSQPVYATTKVTGTTGKILETIKSVESAGDYTTPNKAGASSASGAYQFIDSTWQSLTKKYGIGTEYARAMQAPPDVQDAVAAKYVEEILAQNNNDASKIPLVWYTGNAQGQMSSKALAANKGQDASAYQAKWLNAFENRGGGGQQTPEGDGDMLPMSAAGSLQSFSTKDPSHVQGLDGNFQSQLLQFLQAAKQEGHSIRLYSGYRSIERQKELFANAVKKYGSPEAARKWVAPPGRSRHNFGIAADLEYSSGNARQWAHQNAKKFGMHFRMGHEPWHIEPINASSGNIPAAAGINEQELGGGAPAPGGGYGAGSPGNSPMDMMTSQLAGIGGTIGPIAAMMSQAGASLMSGISGIAVGNLFGMGGETQGSTPEGDGAMLPNFDNSTDNRASLLDQNMIQTKSEFATLPATTHGQVAMNNQANEPRTSVGNMALNGAQDRDTLPDWFRELIGGKVTPDSNFGKTVA
jgi:hypothetical protein